MLISVRIRELSLSMAAGFLGALFFHFVSPLVAHAQDKARVQIDVPGQELRAQKFVLVDAHGVTGGVLGFEADGTPTLTLLDKSGRMIWTSKLRAYPLAK
jgi:hypothetical protein